MNQFTLFHATAGIDPLRQRTMALLVLSMLFFCLHVNVAQAEEPIPPQSPAAEQVSAELKGEIDKLVQQLGSPNFFDREAADKRLYEIGLPSFPALRAALESDDQEIVFRATNLMTRIEAKPVNLWIEQLRKPNFKADQFLRGQANQFIETGMIQGPTPPLLDYYRKAFGNERTARAYYVALLRKNPGIFVMGQNYLDATPPASERELMQQVFVEQMENEVNQISFEQRISSRAEPFRWRGKFLDDIAAVLVVHAATEPRLSESSYSSLRFLTTIQAKRGDAKSAKGRQRKLLTQNDLQKKMLRPVYQHGWSKMTTPRGLWCGMELFATFGWKESALKLARRTVELADTPAFAGPQANTRVVLQAQFLAAHHLMIYGGKEDIPVATQLLQQAGTVRVIPRPPGIPRGPELEVREMALLALARLKKEDPKDLGMVENKVYCPFAQTARIFYQPDADQWPKILNRFLPNADAEKKDAKELEKVAQE